MGVTLQIKNIDSVVSSLSKLPALMLAGSKVVGERNTAYALVWEWGSLRLTKPGPKTVWGTNPAGETRILTKTAPLGYIRVNKQKYIEFIREEVNSIDWSHLALDDIPQALEDAMNRAAENCSRLIGMTAPIDTGELRASIMFFPAYVGDSSHTLQVGTELDLGSDW